jgi:hypothetical protein
MRKYFFITLGLSVLLMAATVVSIFEELEISEGDAKSLIIQSFGRGHIFGGSAVSKAKNLPVEVRVEGTRQLIRFAKEYTKTEDFKRKYTKWRKEELGYKQKKFGLPNLNKMIDNAVDKQMNKEDDEKRVPSDPNECIKKRLEQFLEVSATVDFDAELNGSQFVKKKYENQSDQWKLCYRAGREVVEVAREEAEKWLKELE